MTTGRSLLLSKCLFRRWKKMSGVRLSNGSPTLERTEPRVTEHPKPSACRSLFGSVDHEQLNRDFNAHMRELEEAAAAKWGFDFVNDKPLANNGRFNWELVESNQLPDFYKRPPRREPGGHSGSLNVDLNGNHRCVRGVSSEDTVRSDGQTECTGPRKRSACHETSTQRKKSHPSPEEVSCSSLSRSVEHTPRKPSPKRPT